MVLPVEGTNLEPGEADAIGHMVTAAYQLEINEAVVAPTLVKQTLDETGSYQLAAQKLGAREFLYVSAVRLNSRIVVTGSRYSSDGKLLFSEKISATTLDDIEPGSERLARALVAHKTTSETRTIDNVMLTEKHPPNRVGAQKVAGFKGGFSYVLGWEKEVAQMMSLGFDLRLESLSHFVEFGLGFSIPSGNESYRYGGFYTDIGGNLYLTQTSAAPYVGIGVMPRLISGDSTANLALYGQVGVMTFREASTRAYVDLRVGQNLLPVTFVRDVDYMTPEADETDLYPTEITLSVGMGF